MKKIVFLFLCTVLFSCSNEEPNPIDPTTPPTGTTPPKETKPTTPASSLMKPAVVNIKTSVTTKTARTNVVTKRLVKTITFTSTSINDRIYKTKFTAAEYAALPTDNLYDPSEELLNVDTKKYDERIYTYNSNENLERITINNIAYPGYNGTAAYAPITFEYTTSGTLVQIAKYQDKGAVLTYEYNSIGQIIKAFDVDGTLKYTFDYDESNNIISKYLYMNTPNGIKPQMHYTYTYFADNTYAKNWISVNTDGTETKTSTVTYSYDKGVPGVYKNEAIYKILMDNEQGLSYLHITSNSAGYKPKYFYDADGYLMKYDSSGGSEANYITLFIYE
jgi:hypothetical protein